MEVTVGRKAKECRRSHLQGTTETNGKLNTHRTSSKNVIFILKCTLSSLPAKEYYEHKQVACDNTSFLGGESVTGLSADLVDSDT